MAYKDEDKKKKGGDGMDALIVAVGKGDKGGKGKPKMDKDADDMGGAMDGMMGGPKGMEAPAMTGDKGMGSAVSAEVCVPVSSLSSPGEDDQMTSPAEGDMVQFQTEGKISRVEGENAYVTVTSVNGKPISDEGAMTKSTPEDSSMDEFAQLKSEAAGMNM